MVDQRTQIALRQKFNPDGSALRNCQMRLLEMLKYIDSICKEHNIQYWLSSGTCLGAIRHGGFIPWDDDLDIEMLWTDYKKFIKIVNNFNGKDGYIVQTGSNDPYYFYSYGKLRDLNSEIHEIHGMDNKYKFHGYFIDIFPIEPAGSKLFHQGMARLLSRTALYTQKRKLPVFITKKIIYNIVYKGLSIINRAIISYLKTNSYRHVVGHWCLKERMINEIFPLKMSKFEDSAFPVPNNSEGYLKRFYGDYNEIPTLDKVIPHTVEATVSISHK